MASMPRLMMPMWLMIVVHVVVLTVQLFTLGVRLMMITPYATIIITMFTFSLFMYLHKPGKHIPQL